MTSASGSAFITVVVVTWRGASYIADCLQSLAAQSEPADILIIDNASDDGTSDIIEQFQRQHGYGSQIRAVRLPRNEGFAGGMSAALPLVTTEYMAMLNDDAVADEHWLRNLRQPLDDGAAASTSLMILASTGTINNVGVGLTASGYGYDLGLNDDPQAHLEPREVFGFCGGAAMVRMDALRRAGQFPAEFFLYYEDTDTSWRLRLSGEAVRYVPTARVRHLHSATAGGDRTASAFYNERNRLWMLIRCAPASLALRQSGRFCVTTATLFLRGAGGRTYQSPQFSTRLRLRVLASTARRLPSLLRQRRAICAPGAMRRTAWATARLLSD